ncbi:MAG: FecCD family ABC transporter permease [Janibacter sp.]
MSGPATATATAPDAQIAAPIHRARRVRVVALLGMCLVLVVCCILSITIGARDVALSDIWGGLTGGTQDIAQAAVAKRVPRTWLAAVAGAALAMSGVLLQGVTRNPLADPHILGLNTGASLAIVIGIAWFGLSTPTGYIWVAILGAAVTAVFVWSIGSLGQGGATPLKLTLAGAATTAALTSFVTAVVLPRPDIAENVVSWEIGGVGGATASKLLQMAPFLIGGLVLGVWCARGLNMLGLGDDLAAGLGESVARTRVLAGVAAVTLAGATTAITGPIGFVGLVVPHFCRMLVGVDHRWLMPFSALAGASLLLVSDVIGRVIAPPGEVDVGIITAVLGAPVFIAVVRRSRLREL